MGSPCGETQNPFEEQGIKNPFTGLKSKTKVETMTQTLSEEGNKRKQN